MTDYEGLAAQPMTPDEIAASRATVIPPQSSVAKHLVAWWTASLEEPPPPEIFGVLPLAHYSSLYGPWGGSKSWLLCAFAAEAARLGHRVVFIDREADASRFHRRLHKLGAAHFTENIGYMRACDPEALGEAVAFQPRLVLIDSVSASGGEQDEASFMRWHRSVVQPLLDRGIAVCSIDHDNKTTTDPDSGRRLTKAASGTHAKGDRMQGTGMWLTGQALTRQADGDLRLLIDKDNDARMSEREWRVLMISDHGEGLSERITIEVRPRDATDTLRDAARLTPEDEATVVWLNQQERKSATVQEAKAGLGLRSDKAARDRLVRVAHATDEVLPHKARRYLLNPACLGDITTC